MIEDIVALIDVEGLQAGGTASGCAGEGAARSGPGVVPEDVVAGGDACAGLDTPGHILARHQDIRHHVVVLHPPHSRGAAQARQHLIGDHQPVILVANPAHTLEKIATGYPVAALGQAGFNEDGGDVLRRHYKLGQVGFQVPQAVLAILGVAHTRGNIFRVGKRRLQHTARPGFHVQVVIAVVGTDHLGAQALAVKTGREADDVAAAGMAQGQVDGRLHRLGAGHLETETRQRPARHQAR